MAVDPKFFKEGETSSVSYPKGYVLAAFPDAATAEAAADALRGSGFDAGDVSVTAGADATVAVFAPDDERADRAATVLRPMDPRETRGGGPAATADRPARRYNWRHAAAVYLAANTPNAFSFRGLDDVRYYERLDRPRVSPPPWAFGPAWTVNNVASLYAGLRVANLPEGTPGRGAFLALEAAGWVLYAAFAPGFFRLRSPVLGAADSVGYLAVTVASVALALRLDRRAAAALLPRLLWLGLASYIGAAVARRNRDPVFGR